MVVGDLVFGVGVGSLDGMDGVGAGFGRDLEKRRLDWDGLLLDLIGLVDFVVANDWVELAFFRRTGGGELTKFSGRSRIREAGMTKGMVW